MFLALPRRNIIRNRWRTFLIIAGIAISVGLETGIAITIDSLYDDFIKSHRGDNFSDISIHPKGMTTIDKMRNLSKIIKTIPGVETVSPVATITHIDNLSSVVNVPNNTLLYGLDPASHPDYPHIDVESGKLSLKSEEAIISLPIADYINRYSGEKYSLEANPQFYFQGGNVTITGIMKNESYIGNYAGYMFILLELDYMLGRFTNTSFLNFHLVIKVDDFLNINAIAERIEDTKGLGLDYFVYREKSISQNDLLAIRSYQVGMHLIIIASFVVAFLFISNILAINIRDRSPEFGILRAIGSSDRQIIFTLGIELLLYSSIGSSIGIILGMDVSVILVRFLNLNFPTLNIEALVIRPQSLVATFITGILTALISGLYPIFLAISLPVVQNIHWRMRRKTTTSKKWVIFILIGALFTIIGAMTTYFIGPSRFLTFEVISIHFLVIFSIFFGVFLLEIGFLHFLPKLGIRMLFWHSIVPKTIAMKNIKREMQKSTITIMVTALALTFILVIGILSAALIKAVPEYYKERYGNVDIIAEAHDGAQIPLTFADELMANNTDIDQAAYMQQQRTRIGIFEGYVFGITPTSYDYFFSQTMLIPANPNIPALLNATEKGVIISHILRDRIGAKIGDNLTVQVASNSDIEVKITGFATGNPFLQNGFYVFFSHTLFQEYWHNNTAKWFIMTTSPERGSLKIIIENLSEKYPDLKEVIAIDYYKKVIEKSLMIQTAFFQILFLNTFFLSGLAQFICILISTMRMEREMGILRAMGLSKREVFSTFLAESSFLGIVGILIGISNGILGAELIAWYISQSIPIKISFSLDLIIFWVFISLLITLASTVIPSYRSTRKNVANAINSYTPRQFHAGLLSWKNWDRLIDEYLESRFDIISPHLTQSEENK